MSISSLEVGFPSKEPKDRNGDEGSEQQSSCWANFLPAAAPAALGDCDWVVCSRAVSAFPAQGSQGGRVCQGLWAFHLGKSCK